jgi:hypothetical protein
MLVLCLGFSSLLSYILLTRGCREGAIKPLGHATQLVSCRGSPQRKKWKAKHAIRNGISPEDISWASHASFLRQGVAMEPRLAFISGFPDFILFHTRFPGMYALL